MFDQETLEMGQLGELESLTFEAEGEEEGEEEGGYWGNNERFDPEADGEAWGDRFDDREGDRFLGSLIDRAGATLGRATGGIVNADLLKTLARQGATVAAGAIAGPRGAQIARQIANRAIREAENEGEQNFEEESVGESFEAAGGDRQLLDEMHYYAAMLSEAESEAEADHFLGAIAKIAGPLLGSLLGGNGESGRDAIGEALGEEEGYGEEERDGFLPLLLPLAAPLIGQGIGALGKLFKKRRETESAVRALPEILAETGRDLARQYRRGRRPTRQRVATSLARNTARTLGSRRRLSSAIRANRRAAGRAQGRPTPRLGGRTGMPGRGQRTSVYVNGGGRGVPPMPTYGDERDYPTAGRGNGRYGDDGRYDDDTSSGAPATYGTAPRAVRVRGRGALIGYIPVYGVRRPSRDDD